MVWLVCLRSLGLELGRDRFLCSSQCRVSLICLVLLNAERSETSLKCWVSVPQRARKIWAGTVHRAEANLVEQKANAEEL